MRLFALTLILCLPAMAALAKPLEFELSENRVDITTGFDGARVTAFGTIDPPGGNLVVTLKGPEQKVTIRKKARVFGAWMNSDSVEFRRVPSYYDYASTLDAAELAALPGILDEAQVGVDHLGFYAEDEDDEEAGQTDRYRDALIRSMQEKGLYPLRARQPLLIADGFFKVSFELPPGVPTGTYTMEAVVIDGDRASAREARTLQVGQVGFNARIYLFAQRHEFLYGVIAVLIAAISGWSAFTFLRRD